VPTTWTPESPYSTTSLMPPLLWYTIATSQSPGHGAILEPHFPHWCPVWGSLYSTTPLVPPLLWYTQLPRLNHPRSGAILEPQFPQHQNTVDLWIKLYGKRYQQYLVHRRRYLNRMKPLFHHCIIFASWEKNCCKEADLLNRRFTLDALLFKLLCLQ